MKVSVLKSSSILFWMSNKQQESQVRAEQNRIVTAICSSCIYVLFSTALGLHSGLSSNMAAAATVDRMLTLEYFILLKTVYC